MAGRYEAHGLDLFDEGMPNGPRVNTPRSIGLGNDSLTGSIAPATSKQFDHKIEGEEDVFGNDMEMVNPVFEQHIRNTGNTSVRGGTSTVKGAMAYS